MLKYHWFCTSNLSKKVFDRCEDFSSGSTDFNKFSAFYTLLNPS